MNTVPNENLRMEPVREARTLIDAARNESRNIIESAKAQALDIIDSARIEAERERTNKLLEITSRQEEIRGQYFRSNESRLLELAFCISKEITAFTLEHHPESLLSRISRAIDSVENVPILNLELSREDYSNTSIREWAEESGFNVLALDSLRAGNARLKTASSVIEICLETHIEQLRNSID